MDVVVKHKVVGVDGSLGRSVVRIDVDTAAGKRKKAPIFDSDGPSRRGGNNDLGYRELVLEDEIVLRAEESFGYRAVNDATSISCQFGVLLY